MSFDKAFTAIASPTIAPDLEEPAGEVRSVASVVAAATPFWRYQWHLEGRSGANASSAWADYTGRGVKIGVVDEGFDLTNPDLDGRFNLNLSQDPRDKGAVSILPDSAAATHGTWVAGVIGAKANDGFGAAGVAFDADLVGYYLRQTGGSTRSEVAAILSTQKNVDISNNSWGYTTAFSDNLSDPIWGSISRAIDDVAANGRGGLGTVMVFAAGNDRAYVAGNPSQDGDNTNNHGLTNSRKTIAVGATDQTGKIAPFSTPGASLFVVAPGVDIATTAPDNGDGDRTNDLAVVSGTSLAAPVVSGVVAMMLEANPSLGYRDVQKILAISSVRTDAGSASWAMNGASEWNGGGYAVSHDYGFGLVDAVAATRLAETWTATSTAANEAMIGATAPGRAMGRLVDHAAREATMSIADGDFKVEWAEVSVDITHSHVGDLVVELVSPHGTVSRLLDRPGDGNNARDNLSFTFSTTHNWGETAAGAWTVRVLDAGSGGEGTLNAVSLRLYGERGGDDTHYFTDDFAAWGRNGAIRADGSGDDQINFAAVSSDVAVDLGDDGFARIAGRTIAIERDAIVDAIAGDGNDRVVGNEAGNTLLGGRGSDTLSGEGGNDTVSGGLGDDRLSGGAGRDRLAGDDGADAIDGGGGNDTLIGGGGRDSLNGDLGDDRIFGGDGADFVNGGTGNDVLYGEAGADEIFGDQGNDMLVGGADADQLFGGSGRDQLQGGDGSDWVWGGQGSDTLSGGEGADVFAFDADDMGKNLDRIMDFEQGQDRIDISMIVKALKLDAAALGQWLVQEQEGGQLTIAIRTTTASPESAIRLATLDLPSAFPLAQGDFIL